MSVGDHSEPHGVPRDVPGADQKDVVGDQPELAKPTIENRAFTDYERAFVRPVKPFRPATRQDRGRRHARSCYL